MSLSECCAQTLCTCVRRYYIVVFCAVVCQTWYFCYASIFAFRLLKVFCVFFRPNPFVRFPNKFCNVSVFDDKFSIYFDRYCIAPKNDFNSFSILECWFLRFVLLWSYSLLIYVVTYLFLFFEKFTIIWVQSVCNLILVLSLFRALPLRVSPCFFSIHL